MENPWKHIIEGDYIGHMNSPNVQQRPLLNRILKNELRDLCPSALLILGCSTGNGLEHVDLQKTNRIDCVDIHPEFIQRLQERYPELGSVLSVHCADLHDHPLETESYSLVFAALIFEYVDWKYLFPRIAASIVPKGYLSIVIQRRSESTQAVTPTQYTSLQALESIFHFVDPEELVQEAADRQFLLESRSIEPLPSGKAFEIFRFRKNTV